MSSPYVFDWRWALKASPEQLWVLVSDTNRLNQVTGIPRVDYREIYEPDGTMRRLAHAQIYRWLALDWEEVPFEWVKPLRWSIKRIFSSRLFPIKSLINFFTFTPLPDGGTELQYRLTLEPNGILGRLLIPGIAQNVHASFGKAFQQMDDYLQQLAERPFELPPVQIIEPGRTRFENLIRELRQARHQPELIDKLEAHLKNSAVEDLTRMRPYALASQWGFRRSETLALFLHAASIGLLDLSWDILCPECRGAKHKTRDLYDLPERVHCPSCNIDYAAHFDQSIEATFSINAEVVDATRYEYCIGGPQVTPHILMQQTLQPDESRSFTIPLADGSYRLRVPRLGGPDLRVPASILAPLPGQPWLTVSENHSQTELVIEVSERSVRVSAEYLRTGEIAFTINNHTDKPQIVILEDGAWSDQIATAADVTALQAFRDLFSSEALRPGYTISIKNMEILFSDLKGSTAMYRTVGDAAAFGTVIDHFDILRQVVAEHQGALVKTMGDAVMAVFRDSGDGFKAAVEMLRRIDAYNEGRQEQRLVLKVGLHQGPCIAVNLNDRLDYFGTTVNLASRLEGQSSGGDIVTSDAIIDDPAVKAVVEAAALRVEPFTAILKGVEGDRRLYRICLPEDNPLEIEDAWVDVSG